MKNNKYSIFGSGNWGTALANIISLNYGDAVIFCRDKNIGKEINLFRQNIKYFPKNYLSKNLKATSNIQEALEANILLFAIPCQKLREFAESIRDYDFTDKIIILCCKGVENNSLKFPSEIIKEILGDINIGLLSGPNFASEIINILPTASVIALSDQNLAQIISKEISGNNFITYISKNIINIETAGAMKNIIAIACGIVKSLNLGQNAAAYIISLGLEEIYLLSKARNGAQAESKDNIAIIGDLILTCTSESSRNFSFGLNLNKTHILENLSNLSQTIEGYHSTKSIYDLSKKLQINLKLVNIIYDILYMNGDIKKNIELFFE